jgi:alcohol dehydrogenase
MRAVVYEQFRQLPELADVAPPACPPDGALVAVRATGVCRSDWHGWMGHDPDVHLPHVPGHEFAGEVVAVGPEVTGWRPEDRVTAPFVCACGRCQTCLDGNETVCPNQAQPGFTHWGSFAETVVVHHADTNLVGLPDGLSFETAAALGCRFATSYRAVVHHGRVSPGQWVSVHGCGGVGLSAVAIASSRHARVVAIDVSPAALDLALAMGAEVAVDARRGSTAEQVKELTGGGAHLSIDALGSRASFAAAIGGLRRRGRHVQVGLLLGSDADPPAPMSQVIAQELEIVGSHGMAARDYPEMLAAIAEGTLDPGPLVTRTVGLDEAPAALAGMDTPSGPGITVVVLEA